MNKKEDTEDTDYLDNFIESLTDKEIREFNNEDEVTEKDVKFAMQVANPATVKNITKVIEEVKGRKLDIDEAAFILKTLHRDKNIFMEDLVIYHLKEVDKYYYKI